MHICIHLLLLNWCLSSKSDLFCRRHPLAPTRVFAITCQHILRFGDFVSSQPVHSPFTACSPTSKIFQGTRVGLHP